MMTHIWMWQCCTSELLNEPSFREFAEGGHGSSDIFEHKRNLLAGTLFTADAHEKAAPCVTRLNDSALDGHLIRIFCKLHVQRLRLIANDAINRSQK